MFQAYTNIFIIFSLMFLGYFLSYRQWFTNRTADVFSKLLLNLSLPFSMFLNITANFNKSEFLSLVGGMLIPLCSMIVTFLTSLVYRRFFKVADTRKGTFSTMFTCSNTIFIGLPINLAIFGSKAVAYVLLYYIVNTTIFWTLGVFEIAKDNPKNRQQAMTFHPLVTLKKVFSPALMGFIIGLIWMFTGVKVPLFLHQFGQYLADLTTPLSMFAIGIMIYFAGIKQLKMNWDVFGVLLGRFILSPLIVWLLGLVIPVPPLMLAVFMVQSAMPVQNSVPILARVYQADQEFASSTLGYSVLIYLAYIPLLLKVIYSL